eukprot:PhF_6_TR25589/c0_g1_i1/m.35896/K09704/K09704; uncharacterized protein
MFNKFVLIVVFAVALSTAGRPPPNQRKFNSTAVEAYITSVLPRFKDPNLATIFQNCLPNTLDTTVEIASSNDSFIITGDIDAMWLRDSTNQVLPYVRFLRQDPALAGMVRGVVLRQFRSVILDSYANAYNVGPNGQGHQTDKRTPPMTPPVFEGKYEIDSLAAVLKLAYAYFNQTQDTTILDSTFLSAADAILTVVQKQMLSTTEQKGVYPYQFYRNDGSEYDKYPAAPAAHTNMIRSAFRPSDDQTKYDFLVSANAMMSVELDHLSQLASKMSGAHAQAVQTTAKKLSKIVRAGVESNGTKVMNGVKRYVFEVDGFGNVNDMDDGNIPALLALPYLGYCSPTDPTYLATRSYVLSTQNPWYFQGSAAKGVGSPHTGSDMIWPMALIVQGITSTNDTEIQEVLNYLTTTTAGTYFMHESFNKNDPQIFTRSWFAWANTLFGEFIMMLADTKPYLIFK